MAEESPVLQDDNDVIFEGEDRDEIEELKIDSTKRSIRTDAADPEIESLFGKYKRGKLVLQPNFQRYYVWDAKKASKLIESALLSVPLPIIYLAEEASSKESVIDGQQRLTSFFAFMDGKFPDGRPFRLTGLKVFHELNKKSFADLDENLQDKIRYYQIRTITIRNDSDGDLKFEIFERLNTGAVALNDMELRNCIYRGDYITLLKELAADGDFMSLVGFKKTDPRMRDVELVLRFAAFYHATYLKYHSPMKLFFNKDMERYQNISKHDADELKAGFKNSIQIIKTLFGNSAFRRYQKGSSTNQHGSWESKQFNASLYDVLMGVFAGRDKNQVYHALDSLREGLIDLMVSNQEFIDAILLGTSDPDRVRKRFDVVRQLVDDVLRDCIERLDFFRKWRHGTINQLPQALFNRPDRRPVATRRATRSSRQTWRTPSQIRTPRDRQCSFVPDQEWLHLAEPAP